MSPDTEDVFNDAFWERLDWVVNAMDNVTATWDLKLITTASTLARCC